MPRTLKLYVLVCAIFATAALAPAETLKSAADPDDVATRFLQAFADKDIDTVVSLFAPGARVQRARLANEGAHDLAQFEALAWAEESKEAIAGVRNFRIEVLEVSSLGFGPGVTVSVHFRATGEVGENTGFVNEGVDSFSLVRVDGSWRILLYNSMEKLVIG